MITMAHAYGKKGSLPRKGKHWSHRVRETILCRSSDGSFNLKIDGGAENGEFIIIGGIKEDKVKYKKGKLLCDDVVLEINNQPVAGYTRPDVLTLINKNGGDAVSMRTVKPGHGITRDLREYLGARFEKNTLDNDLQQTIRENLYRRTVPCTTRGPRNGEIPDVDYVFLSMYEFQQMEKSGALLESGIYDGNHYGTPKPPKLPVGTLTRKKARPSSVTRMERSHESLPDYNDRNADFPGPLPPNWEIAYSETNEKYYINHETGTTQWMDPRHATSGRPEDCDEDELPYGWERVDDPKYGTYYIDHETRKTQFENPVTAARRNHDNNQNSYYDDDRPAPYRGPPSFNSAAALAKAQEAEAMSRWPQMGFDHSQPPAYNHVDHYRQTYTIGGRQLDGELIKTTLLKGSRGFGFTIIGGDEPGELLQIKSIVADGAAAKDGKLRTGDALVRLNGQPVVSKTHQEVVSIFQSMPSSEAVELDMIRGYPLPFDPDDPNVETIGSYTVVRSPTGRSDSPGSYNQGGHLQPGTKFAFPKSSSDQSLNSSNASGGGRTYRQGGTGTFPRTSTSSTMSKSAPEVHYIRVVKGPMGFGFTIADSPYGQKVKQILDAPRCTELQEGDILLEINNKQIRNYNHKEAVEMLQHCPKGREAVMVIQRGGIPTPLKNSPLTGRRQEELHPSGRMPRPKSTPPMGYIDDQRRPSESSQRAGSWGNLATSGESTRNQETGYGYRDSQNSSSLRRGMGVRRSQEHLNGPYDDGDVHTVSIRKGTMGFGFRVVGGKEEDTQVSIGTVVPGSPADTDGRLQCGDEIVSVNDQSVVLASHHHVIALIHESANTGRVILGIRKRHSRSGRSSPVRRPFGNSQVRVSSRSAGNLTEFGNTSGMDRSRGFQPPPTNYGRDRRRSESDRNDPDVPVLYRDVVLTRGDNEGFGFVILSSVRESGSTIGRIIQGSPADRCGQLVVGDKLVAVNETSIVGMHHSEIVDTIKQSGKTVALTIAQKPSDKETKAASYKSAPNVNRFADGYVSDREDYRRQNQSNFDRQREDQRMREEEEAMERERVRREREEMRLQEERKREDERRREAEREARRIETERKEAERREEELRRQEQLRRDEEIRREEERRKDEERKWQDEKKREDEKRWALERAEDKRWGEDRRRQADNKKFEEDRRQSGRMRYDDDGRRDQEMRRVEEERRREDERRQEDERRREDERSKEEEFRRQDAIRKREEEEKLQEELKRRNEETRMQEEVRRRLEVEARRQEDRKKEEDQRRRDDEQVRQRVQEVQMRSNQPIKKAPPPVLPKPSKAKVQQARDERHSGVGYGTLPARPAPQDHRYRRLSGGDVRPEPPTRTFQSRGKSESDLARAFRRNDESDNIEVELYRKSQGYGFSIRGGRELNMSIFVLKIAEGGIADLDGRIRVGDEILEINSRSTKDLLHTDAIGMIRGGNRVRLTLKRNKNPPVFDDLPNGGPNRSVSHAQRGRPSSGSYEHTRPISNY